MAIFFALSKQVAFKILALVVSDSLKALIKIAYPGWNIMEKTWKSQFEVLTSGRLLTLDVKCWERYIITPPWHAATRLVFDFFIFL